MRACDTSTAIGRVEALRRRGREEGLPLHATLELTRRCNFRCVHCYVLPNANAEERELTGDEWLALAREAADAGCFSVLLTGGEPLLRPDFPEIYLGIRALGVHVMIFTNATLVNRRVLDALRLAPPRLIEVTVYGASPETYRAVTGRAEGYLEALEGIERLREAGMPVALKTILMNLNAHEFEAIRALGREGERRVRYDAAIHARFPGDRDMEGYRLPPEELVELEARVVPELREEWARTARREAEQAATAAERGEVSDRLYTCAAGAISFYATATGLIQPCVSAGRYAVPWQPGRLLEAFRQSRAELMAARKPADHACADCAAKPYCGSCPAVADLETGREDGVFPYACEIAHARLRRGRASGNI
jgi:radical SAM protein with 4Fe4S-binding SPASM domain